jgi:hypothetical protein
MYKNSIENKWLPTMIGIKIAENAFYKKLLDNIFLKDVF